jgi:two-component system sensor histidine kinase/response regulator
VPSQLPALRALVVDDNPSAREILQDMLTPLVGRVETVASGAQALERVQQEAFDVVFMDWRMPGMDGLQTSRQLRSLESLERQPAIVMVTAFGREEVREEAERIGLDGFLVKPVTKSMIVDTLVTVFAEPGEVGSMPAAEKQHLAGIRILLTEDNEINQQIAIELLEGVGACVEVANNGREAVEKLTAGNPYDVVLMDLQMPEMDGFQATARIRSEERFKELPILAMTAHATLEERQRCLDAGMNEHITKPIDPAKLFEAVSRFCGPRAGAAPVAAKDVQHVDLPPVEGLAIEDGLRRVGGNRKLYRKLLGQFAEQQARAPEAIAEALAQGDVATAERLAHTLKGVAGNIGAMPVQAAAAELEKAIRDRAPSETALINVREVLGPLVAQLKSSTATEEVAPVAAADPAAIKAAGEELGKLLDEFDPGAVRYVEENEALFRSLFTTSFFDFNKQLQDFAFSEARELLNEALARV